MKKIFFVDNSIRCFCLFRLSAAKAFKQIGYEIWVLTPESESIYINLILNEGIKHLSYKMSSKFSPIQDIKLLLLFRNLYKRLKPDYIFHYTIKPNIYGTLAAKLCSIPSVAIVPGTGSVFQNKGIISYVVVLLCRFAFKFPDKIWVLNKDDYKAFLSNNIVRLDKIEILPSEGIDLNYYKSNEIYCKHKPFVFLYMGRMLKEKGLEYIIEAAKLLRSRGHFDFEIHLLGLTDGLSKDVIPIETIKIWEKEKYIKFLGSVLDVRNNIEQSDCVLLPTFYGEGAPRSLMEACAMERIVIATDNVGCRDIVDDGINGFFCKVKDKNDLADKMEYVLLMPETDVKKMGINGKLKMQQEFEETIIINKYLSHIQNNI